MEGNMSDTIATLNLKLLSNDEVFGFLNDVTHQLLDTFTVIPDYAQDFIAAQSDFNEALKGKDDVLTTKELSAADHDTDQAWGCLNAYLKIMKSHPVNSKREAAETIYQQLTKYENPAMMSNSAKYGILERLLLDLKALPKEIFIEADADAWLKDLDHKCAKFVQMYSARVQDKATKILGITKAARIRAINAYRNMVKLANAMLMISPSTELTHFASHLNELISSKQTAIKIKKTKSINTDIVSCLEPNDDDITACVIE